MTVATTKMKILSLKELLVKECPYDWFNGGWVERFAMEHGYKASNGSRRARELENSGAWERKEEKGSVWYRRAEKEKKAVINGIEVKVFKEKIPEEKGLW